MEKPCRERHADSNGDMTIASAHLVALASAQVIEVPNATRAKTPLDEYSRIDVAIARER